MDTSSQNCKGQSTQIQQIISAPPMDRQTMGKKEAGFEPATPSIKKQREEK